MSIENSSISICTFFFTEKNTAFIKQCKRHTTRLGIPANKKVQSHTKKNPCLAASEATKTQLSTAPGRSPLSALLAAVYGALSAFHGPTSPIGYSEADSYPSAV